MFLKTKERSSPIFDSSIHMYSATKYFIKIFYTFCDYVLLQRLIFIFADHNGKISVFVNANNWHVLYQLLLNHKCIFTSPQTLFGREVLFYSCESVILWLCDQDFSESSRSILIKFGRMLSYNINKV